MNIIIAGCGKVGGTILKRLVGEGHNVTALDQKADVVSSITDIHDVMGIVGNAADCETLEKAGVSSTDLFVAVTESDDTNMLSCFLAKKMGAGHTIARIRTPEYNDDSLSFMRQQLELSMSVNPERLAAEELYNILMMPAAVKVDHFSRRTFEMVEIQLKEESVLDGMTLSEMRNQYKANVLICVVSRGAETFIPDGSFALKSGDRIGVCATHAELQKYLKSLRLMKKQSRSVMILGGSRIAYYLTKMLTASGADVKIIEKDREHCEALCEMLPEAVIINGEGSHQEVLLEEGLDSMDAFVSLTGVDEQNILISMFASTRGVPKVITKISRTEMESMAGKLGLDTIVVPRKIVSDVVVRYARARQNSLGSHIETLYNVMGGQAEALEFRVGPDFPGSGIPLRELKPKPGILVAGIVHNRKPIIPSGDSFISEGDMVVVIARHRKSGEPTLQDLSDILG